MYIELLNIKHIIHFNIPHTVPVSFVEYKAWTICRESRVILSCNKIRNTAGAGKPFLLL